MERYNSHFDSSPFLFSSMKLVYYSGIYLAKAFEGGDRDTSE
jgi:hypothetical protein